MLVLDFCLTPTGLQSKPRWLSLIHPELLRLTKTKVGATARSTTGSRLHQHNPYRPQVCWYLVDKLQCINWNLGPATCPLTLLKPQSICYHGLLLSLTEWLMDKASRPLSDTTLSRGLLPSSFWFCIMTGTRRRTRARQIEARATDLCMRNGRVQLVFERQYFLILNLAHWRHLVNLHQNLDLGLRVGCNACMDRRVRRVLHVTKWQFSQHTDDRCRKQRCAHEQQ